MNGKQHPERGLLRRNQRGSSMIELCLGMPLLILFLFGSADFGRLFYAANEVANAAAAGAQYGSLKPSNMTNSTGITAAAKNDALDLPDIQIASSQVCQDDKGAVISCTTPGAWKYAKVTASYTFRPMITYPLIPSSVAILNTVMMRSE